MRDYWKRLKTHPGIGTATMMTILGGLSGATNKSMTPLIGFCFGTIFSAFIFWGIVLISNINRK